MDRRSSEGDRLAGLIRRRRHRDTLIQVVVTVAVLVVMTAALSVLLWLSSALNHN